jgi:hypothetical protein
VPLERVFSRTAILPLTPSLVALSPAVVGQLARGESQVLEPLTHHSTGVEMQARVNLVKDLLETDGQQPISMCTEHTCAACRFPYKSAGAPVLCEQQDESVWPHSGGHLSP